MTVAFRLATEADVPAILALLTDDALGASREGAQPEAYIAAFREIEADANNVVIVGVSQDVVVATYQLSVIPGLSLRASRRAQLEGVRVARHLRSQGIGAAMIADAERRARNAGCTLMQLTMNSSRKDAARFYEQVGFTPSHIGYKRDLS